MMSCYTRAIEMGMLSENLKYISIAAALMIIGITLGISMPLGEGEITDNPLLEGLESIVGYYTPYNPLSVAFLFFKNTLTVAMAFFLGPLLLIVPVMVLALNGFLLGMVANVVASQVSFAGALASLLPHGVFELPALVIASAAGIRFGIASMKKLRAIISHTDYSLAADFKKSSKLVLVAIALLLVAALLETYLTPYILELVMVPQ